VIVDATPSKMSACEIIIHTFVHIWPSPLTSDSGKLFSNFHSHEKLVASFIDWLIVQGLTSHQTHYRSYRGQFSQVIWPNQQCQSTEGSQLVFQIRLESHQNHCYNNTTLGNRLYAWRKGPNVTNPICWSCKNCSYAIVLLTVNIVSHNPAQSSSDNIPS